MRSTWRLAELFSNCTVFALALTFFVSAANAESSRWQRLMSALQASVTITADSASWRGFEFTDLHLPLAISDGRVQIENGYFRLAEGTVEFALTHAPRADSSIELSGRGLRSDAHPDLAPWVEGLPLDVDISLQSRGASIAALSAATHGHVRVRNMGMGRLLPMGDDTGAGLMTALLSKFTPLNGAIEAREVECLAMDWQFANGRAASKDAFALLTPRVTVTGGGTIELPAARVDIELTPRARSGFDPAALAIAKAYRVNGALGSPQVEVVPGAWLGKAAAFGGQAVATLSGARLLGAVRQQSDEKPEPCAN